MGKRCCCFGQDVKKLVTSSDMRVWFSLKTENKRGCPKITFEAASSISYP
jgi:hypothetical protein